MRVGPESPLLLRRVAILPGEGPFIARGFILIEGERVRELGPGDGPAVEHVRDGDGLVAIPGLINAHTHLALTAYRGVADDVRLFGFLEETRKHWSLATPEDAFESSLAGCQAALQSGTTCLVDSVALSPRPAAEACRQVGVRLVGGAAARSLWFGEPARDTLLDGLKETEATAADYAHRDLMYVPYLAAHSPYNCAAEQIRRAKAASRERGWMFAIHLAESQEEIELIRQWHRMTPTEYLDSLGVLDDRTLLAHGVFLTDEDIRRIADRGSHLAHCPKSNAKLGNGVAPVPSCLRSGVSVALGTDSMVSNNNLDMLEEMRFAALIHRAARRDPAVLTAREIFAMATIGGARAIALAHEIGSLVPGKRADLVLLALHPPQGLTEQAVLSELVFHATAETVRTVIVNGRTVFDDRTMGASRPTAPRMGA